MSLRILHVIGDSNPAMGGAIEGVLRLGDAYRELGHSQELLTLDDPGDPWVAQCPSPIAAMGRPGPKKRFYPYRAISWLQQNADAYDGIVVDGLWNASTYAARRVLPRQTAPYCVFPHGMLDPWFRQVQPRKEWVKRQLFKVNESHLLRSAKSVLFTTEQERRLALQSWPGWAGVSHKVVGFGTGEPPPDSEAARRAFRASVSTLDDRPLLLFLSRLHPKKGCEILLEGFASQPAMEGWQLVMAGPGDESHVFKLKAVASSLGIDDRVHWPGMLKGDAKWGALHSASAMALTSFQENFGVVVAEALACQTPVLISDQVNIHEDVARAEAGLVCEATPGAIGDACGVLSAMSGDQLTKMGERGRLLFEESFLMTRVAQRIIETFANE